MSDNTNQLLTPLTGKLVVFESNNFQVAEESQRPGKTSCAHGEQTALERNRAQTNPP